MSRFLIVTATMAILAAPNNIGNNLETPRNNGSIQHYQYLKHWQQPATWNTQQQLVASLEEPNNKSNADSTHATKVDNTRSTQQQGQHWKRYPAKGEILAAKGATMETHNNRCNTGSTNTEDTRQQEQHWKYPSTGATLEIPIRGIWKHPTTVVTEPSNMCRGMLETGASMCHQ